MSLQNEKEIFDYLDGNCSPETRREIKEKLASNPEFNAQFLALESVHKSMSELPLDKSPPDLPAKVMTSIKTLPSPSYHFGDDLFTGKGFFLVTGILTAMIALLSLLSSGYVSLEQLETTAESYKIIGDLTFLKTFFSKKMLTTSMLAVYGILSLALLDRMVLKPLFRKKIKQVSL